MTPDLFFMIQKFKESRSPQRHWQTYFLMSNDLKCLVRDLFIIEFQAPKIRKVGLGKVSDKDLKWISKDLC